ncbi:MAG: hypothetical protein NTX85_03900, partial [Candidatus Nomurabacteria bacterium]|nr:hypothetical protein [Candidatus Nomurabacteria bacterium]
MSTWSGVTVSSGHIRTLGFNNNLVGTLPAEIGNLSASHFNQLNILNNPGLTGSIPASVGNLSNLVIFNLSSNNLTGAIPSSVNNLTKLVGAYLAGNHLSGVVPDLSAITTSGVVVSLNNNDFTFGDLEPNLSTFNRTGFTYTPQNTVDTARNLSFAEGDTMVITPSVAVNTNDSYQWYKNGTLISGATSRIYTKTFHEMFDSGAYSYRITNSVITGTTLQSANITVPTVTPNPPTPDSIYYSLSGNTLWVRGSI